MQVHLEGSTIINAPRASVFGLLTDTKFLAETLPDAEDVRVLDDRNLEAKLKVRVALVSTSLRAKMTLTEVEPPAKARLAAVAAGSGSNISIESAFELTGDSPTTMKWSADADITGVMAGLGSTLLKGFATKKVAEIFSGITRAIEARAH